MKTRLLTAALALASLIPLSSQAGTDTTSFNVVLNLTPACEITMTDSTLTIDYTAVGAAVTSTDTAAFNATCTNHLAYTFSLNVGTLSSGVYNATNAAVDLDYTVTLKSGASAVAFDTVKNGTGEVQAYVLEGSAASGQAGNCGAANFANAAANPTSCTSGNVATTLTVTY